jgi:hypothetical protein
MGPRLHALLETAKGRRPRTAFQRFEIGIARPDFCLAMLVHEGTSTHSCSKTSPLRARGIRYRYVG